MKGLLLLSIFSLSIAVVACSGGESGSNNGSSPSAAGTERIVYLADQDIDEVFELYLAGSSIKLNPSLSPGKNVLDFQITPDKTAVVYRADQDTNDVFELYRVAFATPGVSAKLNSSLPAGGTCGVRSLHRTAPLCCTLPIRRLTASLNSIGYPLPPLA